MEASRFRALFANLASFSSQRLQKFRNFSSLSSAAASLHKKSTFDQADEGGSSVYRHALKFQRPCTIGFDPKVKPTIQLRNKLFNSVSFIGTVELPLKEVNRSNSGRFGVSTFLRVKGSGCSGRLFRILLLIWDQMAEMCLKHLKPNDLIYVSGYLGSYPKAHVTGNLRTCYKVTVKEINYVAKYDQRSTCQESGQLELGESGVENYKNRLHLWQVFFANPHEWWDYRKRKRNPKHPDFKHKDTGEVLWLNRYDPPWVERQLQLHDSRMAEQGLQHVNYRSQVSPLVYD